MSPPPGIRIAIDRGGTFTDCVGTAPGGARVVVKLLSEDPANYADAPLEGIRRVLGRLLGETEMAPRGALLNTGPIESIRMGTTVATNALLERRGERVALAVTRGFRDCLVIGNQSRPRIFDLSVRRPGVLYEEVVEVDERVTLEDYAEDPKGMVTRPDHQDPDLVTGTSGEAVRILRRPDEDAIRAQLQAVHGRGIRSLAVCLMHGYTFPAHEAAVGRIAREVGFAHVSLSHALTPMIRLVPRAASACADAYLTPIIGQYIAGFRAGFAGGPLGIAAGQGRDTNDGGKGARCEFMQSDGGLVDVDRFTGLRAVLSGPAGGVVGYARTSWDEETRVPVIGFDMGGTSTDVSRYGGDGRYEHVFETTTAGVTIQSPQLDINTVAAGGGSRLYLRNGLFAVGPESAGAHPGPACYRKGGPATITDANLHLGRLLPDFFPRIFGPAEDEPLDTAASERVLAELAAQIRRETGRAMTVDEVAYGFLQVADEAMARSIRAVTEARGHDAARHRLATFGGAGGQHAVAVAERLAIRLILVHRLSSVLSAYGLALADVVDERQEPDASVWRGGEGEEQALLREKMARLRGLAGRALAEQGFADQDVVFEEYLNMRYRGTESALMVPRPAPGRDGAAGDYGAAFAELHQREFGFTMDGREVMVDDVRVRAIGHGSQHVEESADRQLRRLRRRDVDPDSKMDGPRRSVYFAAGGGPGGRIDTAVYRLDALDVGDVVAGPAIIADGTQTIVVPPGSRAVVLETHLVIEVGESAPPPAGDDDAESAGSSPDPVSLSIFGHRFMAIAEQMGRTLQKTSVSTNVKERLDFSCALFDPDGGLVANAPHVPVHLGSMSTCVRRQADLWRGRLAPGDVVVTNHPAWGGTHLPDVTVITPAFAGDGTTEILFYVASRAHHADIGGITAGSMPPHSRELWQEGAAIAGAKLVTAGRFDEDLVATLFRDEPARHPGCSGARRLADVVSDLRAQVSANRQGINLLEALMREPGGRVTVQRHMTAIQRNAEECVRSLLRDVAGRAGLGRDLVAEDYMDDGTPIRLRVTIDPDRGEAVFDFAGTGPQVYANTNAPEAVTLSAVIYCLRCLVELDIPLNQGCLAPVKVVIPPGSLLSPSEGAAVAGGNVLTSQRVTDVVLRAFRACAASQGDCNNLSFGLGRGLVGGGEGSGGFGYYETIAGGSGAGPGWHGASGVHTHMTNTRITDPEVLERRYPVVLREFGLRSGSGGRGRWRGGEGVRREIEVRVDGLEVSILSERRVMRPYGLEGGEDGGRGENIWIRRKKRQGGVEGGKGGAEPKEGEEVEERIGLGGKNSVMMNKGDRILICTPGGGGWGTPWDGAEEGEKRGADNDPTSGWKGGSWASREQAALQA